MIVLQLVLKLHLTKTAAIFSTLGHFQRPVQNLDWLLITTLLWFRSHKDSMHQYPLPSLCISIFCPHHLFTSPKALWFAERTVVLTAVWSRGQAVLLKDRCFWALGDFLGQRTRGGLTGATPPGDDSFINALTKCTKRQKKQKPRSINQAGFAIAQRWARVLEGAPRSDQSLCWLNPAMSKVSVIINDQRTNSFFQSQACKMKICLCHVMGANMKISLGSFFSPTSLCFALCQWKDILSWWVLHLAVVILVVHVWVLYSRQQPLPPSSQHCRPVLRLCCFCVHVARLDLNPCGRRYYS